MLSTLYSLHPLNPVTAAIFWRSKADRLLKVDFEKVDRDDPSKTWTDSETYNSNDPIYAGQIQRGYGSLEYWWWKSNGCDFHMAC